MKKVVIIAGVVAVVAVVALVVARPGAGRKADPAHPAAWITRIGALAPEVPVTVEDVTGQRCWSADGVLTAQSGQTCRTRLPDRATTLRVCVLAGTFERLEVKGRNYGPERSTSEAPGCDGDGEKFSLYDERSSLTVSCPPLTGPCRLRLR